MTTRQSYPAQHQLVNQLIDWALVRSRLNRYRAIKRTFPLTILQNRSESPPYYCHYMSWRLGTWLDESLFERLEELLCCAEVLPDWKHERRSLVGSADFAEFWSLLWQLQVAEHLCQIGTDVRWARSGPDLSVQIDSERWFVECYTYRKSFGLLSFLEELLLKIDSDVRVYHDLFLPFRLPRNSGREAFLNTILLPFLDPAYLESRKEQARQQYPVILYRHPNSSLRVYVEGSDIDAYEPGIIPHTGGDSENYLETALQEAVRAKQNSNKLEECRPNLLAVNYLLSVDFQVAESSPRTPANLTIPAIEPNIDALAVSTVGIDERLTREKLRVRRVNGSRQANYKCLDQIADQSGAGTLG